MGGGWGRHLGDGVQAFMASCLGDRYARVALRNGPARGTTPPTGHTVPQTASRKVPTPHHPTPPPTEPGSVFVLNLTPRGDTPAGGEAPCTPIPYQFLAIWLAPDHQYETGCFPARDMREREVADSTAAHMSAREWRLSRPEHSGC
jgi:hypothetical protein